MCKFEEQWCLAAARGEFSPQLSNTTSLKIILALACWRQVVDCENSALVQTKCTLFLRKFIPTTWYHTLKRDRWRCWDTDKNYIDHEKNEAALEGCQKYHKKQKLSFRRDETPTPVENSALAAAWHHNLSDLQPAHCPFVGSAHCPLVGFAHCPLVRFAHCPLLGFARCPLFFS